jgi:hypothetical protein
MGQFKPMVKMETTEPSVILKLKKGGKVAAKMQKESGHAAMSGANPFADAESGMAPKKPSMSARRRAMNPNQYAKGGKVARKQMGGAMPMAGAPTAAMPMAPAAPQAMGRAAMTPQGMPPQAMNRAALAGMAPNARNARAMMVRKALSGMKKGGSANAKCAALERELKHHEAMSASKAHGKASGGAIDSKMTRTTIEGNAGKFAKTKMDTSKKDRAHGTGSVVEGKPAGYKGGGNVSKFVNTKVNDGDKKDKASGTGGVRMGNAGGFKKGGKVPGLTGATVEGGNWENRPADTAKPGKSNTTTGDVKLGNGGGYKMGGRASKKAYATGGAVVNDGKAVKMPRHFVSRPVANSLQSGTFKKGGKVKYQVGGGVDVEEALAEHRRERDAAKETAGSERFERLRKESNEGPRKFISELPGKIYEGAKRLFSPSEPPAGSVTKTEKSVTIAPKRNGGAAKKSYADGGKFKAKPFFAPPLGGTNIYSKEGKASRDKLENEIRGLNSKVRAKQGDPFPDFPEKGMRDYGFRSPKGKI